MNLELRSKIKLNYLALFFVLFFALTVTQAIAVVNVDATASSEGQFNALGVASIDWSHTVGTNLSRVMYVSVATTTTVLPAFPSSRVRTVTYGGTALTLVGFQLSTDNVSSVEIFRLVNPPSGTATVEVTLVPGVANYALGGGTSYSGVDTTNPNGVFTSATGADTFPTVIVPDGVTGDLILDTVAVSPTGQFVARDPSQTLQFEGRSHFSFAFDIGAGSTKPAMSPVTMSWTSVSRDNWAIAGIAIKSLPRTAALSSISGRVLTISGRPISRTLLTLRNLETGEEFYRTSNHFGYYKFDQLETGNLYQIRVSNRRFSFTPDSQTFEINDSVTDLDFVGSIFRKSKNKEVEKKQFR